MKDSSQGPRTDWKVPIDNPFVLREEDGSYEEQEEIESRMPQITFEDALQELADIIERDDREEDFEREFFENLIQDWNKMDHINEMVRKIARRVGVTLDETEWKKYDG